MIGVIADSRDRDVVCEFFELFKTPWEFYRREQHYDVVLCSEDTAVGGSANLLIVYDGRKTHYDVQQQASAARPEQEKRFLTYRESRIPIYGDWITFAGKGNGLLTDEKSHECAAYLTASGNGNIARVGYDLFSEIRTLLTTGQPVENAGIPALDLHIEFLRNLMADCGIRFVEIPPVPEGYQFIACLTHDVDHPLIRVHKLDHTVIGFLLRATAGALIDCVLGRISVRDLVRNWWAAIKLPFVHLGLAKDFWRDFDDRYLELENGIPSTYFLIPRKNYSGKRTDARASVLRASRYEARELASSIRKLTAAGCEVGLHGLDAWVDDVGGRAELDEIRRLTGAAEIGVRMHWLYFDEKSPEVLESAGAAYDSTSGYNQTVGYRAGTTQVFKPLKTEKLLELPLNGMDTALFYLSYLGLSPRKASARLRELADNVVRFGGTLTINWHDRSLAPERLWGGCYSEFIQDLKARGAWFATASQAVAWFQRRRSIVFEPDPSHPGQIRAKMTSEAADTLPGMRVRLHRGAGFDAQDERHYVDSAADENLETNVVSEPRQ
jgi:peptidoglycan/xylan/chitin deacetylase (PgdA/CDA1 family)